MEKIREAQMDGKEKRRSRRAFTSQTYNDDEFEDEEMSIGDDGQQDVQYALTAHRYEKELANRLNNAQFKIPGIPNLPTLPEKPTLEQI
jgi:hypothetical protein